jgi:hypothetical protein
MTLLRPSNPSRLAKEGLLYGAASKISQVEAMPFDFDQPADQMAG